MKTEKNIFQTLLLLMTPPTVKVPNHALFPCTEAVVQEYIRNLLKNCHRVEKYGITFVKDWIGNNPNLRYSAKKLDKRYFLYYSFTYEVNLNENDD